MWPVLTSKDFVMHFAMLLLASNAHGTAQNFFKRFAFNGFQMHLFLQIVTDRVDVGSFLRHKLLPGNDG